MMGSGNDVSDKLVISMTGPLAEDFVVQETNGVSSNMADNVLPNTVAATLLSGAATQLTSSTIQPTVVQLSIQDTPSASGSSCMLLISIPSAAPTAPTAVPLISMPLAAPTATQLAIPTAMQPAAPTVTQLAAMQLTAPAAAPLLPIISVRPNQIGYFPGASSNFYPQSNQFPYMTNPSWEDSQRAMQLFDKVDLQAVLKAGRWSSGGTFTSFYLRDLHVCPQADSLRRTGPLVAAGNIVVISSS